MKHVRKLLFITAAALVTTGTLGTASAEGWWGSCQVLASGRVICHAN
ncbi:MULTISPECIES: hypothetical protein [Deinococcus]|uniref:Uncharacterized protein n=1 Tax=Deinococcus rufus TaxID=2136097 RepID=A0ABV7Z8W3_9DEIO|nr:hypothetical protein [Deinococcus sp. AB2017081]WQE95607.1 hypothetical protein U2P90_01640 [Deinococcus sp. AB2017081]